MKNLIAFKFNHIGIIHNLTLDAITRLKNFPLVSNREAYYIGIKVQNKIFGSTCHKIEYPDFADLEVYFELIDQQNSLEKINYALLQNGAITKNLFDEVRYFADRLQDIRNYKELKKAVSGFMNHFHDNQKLTTAEHIICEGIASVAFFSYDYWTRVEIDPENPWHSFYHSSDDGDKVKRGKFWKVVGVIAADCAGILLGGAAGSVFGPAGAAAGAGAAGAAASKAAHG